MTRRTILTLDLEADPARIAAYREHHAAAWPEVLRSLRAVGVREMEIFALGRRLVMSLQTKPGFDAERDFARHRASNPRCAEWEELMAGFQRAPEGAPEGRLWTPMEKVFSLRAQLAALPPERPRRARAAPAARDKRRPRPRASRGRRSGR